MSFGSAKEYDLLKADFLFRTKVGVLYLISHSRTMSAWPRVTVWEESYLASDRRNYLCILLFPNYHQSKSNGLGPADGASRLQL